MKLPFAQPMNNRDATTQYDSCMVNCYPEKIGEQPPAVKRPGLAIYQQFSAGQGNGICDWNGDLYVIVGGTVYKNGNNFGTVDASAFYAFTQNIDTPNRLVMSNGVKAYYTDGTTLTQITDSNFPASTVPGVVFLDGYTLFMDKTATIYNSNLQDASKYNSLNFIQAEIEPDGGVALAKVHGYVVAFGLWSIEFFYDAGNATGSPLSTVPSMFLDTGCASPASVVNIDKEIFFISQNKTTKGRRVSMLIGGVLETISTSSIDRYLEADSLVNIHAFGLKYENHIFYVLTLKSSNITLVYDAMLKTWHRWTSMTAQASKTITSYTIASDEVTVTCTLNNHGYADGDVIQFSGAVTGAYNITYIDANTFSFVLSSASSPSGALTVYGYTEGYFTGVAAASPAGLQLVQHETNGAVYQMARAYTDDAGNYINTRIRTDSLDGGTMSRKFITELEAVGDKVNSTLLVRYSDDDFQTWSTYRKINLGLKRSRLKALGSTYRRAFEFRHTDSTSLRLNHADLAVEGEAA